MRFVRFIIFVLFLNSLIGFVFLLNIKIIIGTPTKLKNLVKESGAYNITAAAIRENIASYNADLNQGNLMEKLNEQIDPATFQKLAEDYIDQMYTNKTGKMVFKYSMLTEKLGVDVKIPEDQNYNYEIPVITFANLNKMLLASVVSALIFLGLYFLLVGQSLKQKFRWLGIALIFFIIGLGSILASIFIVPNILESLIKSYNVENQKIVNGLIKASQSLLDSQKFYLYLEIILTILVASVLFIISKLAKEDGPTVIPGVSAPKENSK